MRKLILVLATLFIYQQSFTQTLTSEESKLYDLIINYRIANKLPSIPISKSLQIVAQTHVKDLVENKPDNSSCNAHSWSANGKWTACCYTEDHAASNCMWNKPRELTAYKGNGYEIACGSNSCCSDYVMTAEYAIKTWKESSGHNAVMINQGGWDNMKWNAIGVGIYKGFAVVWFGEQADN